MWKLERHVDRAPLTINGALRGASSGMLRGLARQVREWRRWARQEAADQLWEPFDPADMPVTVEVIHLRKNRQGQADPGAAFLLAKAMIDGLADEGEHGEPPLIPGDDERYVRGYWLGPPVVCGHHGVRIVIREHVATGREIHHQTTVRTPAGGISLTGGSPLIHPIGG